MDYNDYIDNSDDDYSYDVENDEHDDDYVDNKKSDLFLCVPNKKKIFFLKGDFIHEINLCNNTTDLQTLFKTRKLLEI